MRYEIHSLFLDTFCTRSSIECYPAYGGAEDPALTKAGFIPDPVGRGIHLEIQYKIRCWMFVGTGILKPNRSLLFKETCRVFTAYVGDFSPGWPVVSPHSGVELPIELGPSLAPVYVDCG